MKDFWRAPHLTGKSDEKVLSYHVIVTYCEKGIIFVWYNPGDKVFVSVNKAVE